MNEAKAKKKKIILKIFQAFKCKSSILINNSFKKIKVGYKKKAFNKDLKILLVFILLFLFYFPANPNQKLSLDSLDYPKFYIDEYKNIFDSLNKRNTFDLFSNKNKIENIFILLVVFPFIKNEIALTKRNPLYDLYKSIFRINNNDIIRIKKKHIKRFSFKLKDILYYKWETIPNRNQTNYLRHILYHYYPDNCLNIYEKSLNLNIKRYISNNNKKLSEYEITDLMSKILYNLIFNK